MAENVTTDFCTICRKNTEYTMQERSIKRCIMDVDYTFTITAAICGECGGEMAIPGLLDRNVRQVEEQYKSCTSGVGARIKRLVELSGFSEERIAAFLDMSRDCFTEVEQDRQALPMKALADLSAFFGISLCAMLRDNNCVPAVTAKETGEMSVDDMRAVARINRILLNTDSMARLLSEEGTGDD